MTKKIDIEDLEQSEELSDFETQKIQGGLKKSGSTGSNSEEKDKRNFAINRTNSEEQHKLSIDTSNSNAEETSKLNFKA